MRIVVAPDSFKGTIGAAGAAAALAEGWRSVRPGDELACVPLADGGEGTLEVLAAAAAAPRWHRVQVTGPAGETVASCWLDLHDATGYIELARGSGLPLMAALDPLGAQTAGTAGGGALGALASADLTGLRPPPPGGVVCLTDVRAPLLGPRGAAAVFGPQKGADAAQVAVLEAGLARLARVLGGDPWAPGAGAAGGTGYGFAAAWSAEITPGAAELCRVVGLDRELAGAQLVITGEGSYDATSGDGKVTGTVLAAAVRAGVPAALVAGVIAADPPPGVAASVALAVLAGGASRAMQRPDRWLRQAGQALASDLASGLAHPDQALPDQAL